MAVISGGEKLEKRLKEIATKANKKATVRVGFLEDATYPDGKSVAMVAAIQEFGAPSQSIPSRPFFRTMVKDKADTWGDATANLLEANDYDAVKTLNQVGAGIAGQLQQSIKEMNAPPLSPITLMLRKMRSDNPDLEVTGATVGLAAAKVKKGDSVGGVPTKPLIDTGNLWNSVSWEVAEE